MGASYSGRKNKPAIFAREVSEEENPQLVKATLVAIPIHMEAVPVNCSGPRYHPMIVMDRKLYTKKGLRYTS